MNTKEAAEGYADGVWEDVREGVYFKDLTEAFEAGAAWAEGRVMELLRSGACEREFYMKQEVYSDLADWLEKQLCGD